MFDASVDGLSLGAIQSVRYLVLKSAWRGHTRYSVQIVTKSTQLLYCSLAGLNTPIQEKIMEIIMLHRHLLFSFVYWYSRQVLLLLMIFIFV